jgi:3-phenylpropionate/trans-cinnamate dioxygenase ferredoxin reductase component
MSSMLTFAIVGASLAGAKAAETLRTEGFDGRILLLGDEPERPYERPPLSKAYLRGEASRDKLYVHDPGFYAAHDIELRTSTRVVSVAPAERRVHLASGERIPYDRLLLAPGAAPRRLEIPGAELDGVLYLRSVNDADALAVAVEKAHRIVVIGAGWIGSEVAASLRQLGREVVIVSPGTVPLERVLGPEIGRIYHDAHAEHGVELRFGTGVVALRGKGRVEQVVTGDGRIVACDLVVVGIGVTPRTALAEVAGLAVDNGVVVNDRLETSAPGVYAAGDVANAWHPLLGRRLRVEHWANALHQGPCAARNMLGIDTPYERIPYFFSDQYDLGMEYSGHATSWDEVVVRGDPAERAFLAFWMRQKRVVAGMNVNVWDVVQPIQALIRRGRPMDAGQLADPRIPLEELARGYELPLASAAHTEPATGHLQAPRGLGL